MAKVSITQKQLETLSRQLYGKERTHFKLPQSLNTPQKEVTTSQYDNYLKKDLIKIGVFSIIAISIQILISTALKNNLLKISF